MPTNIAYAADLHLGIGHVGEKTALHGIGEKNEFAARLQNAKRPLTRTNTAFCVEDRPWTALADGTDDPTALENLIVPQKPSGLDLWVAKAAVAADLVVVRDAQNFVDAHAKIVEILLALGYEPAAHENCGADKLVEASTADEVEAMALIEVLPALTQTSGTTLNILHKNRATKRRLLDDGYYGSWSPSAHQTMVAERFPHNFAFIAAGPHKLIPEHQALGLLVVGEPGFGFAKNAFTRETGQMAFGLTVAEDDKLARDIIQKISGSDEERARLRLEMAVDSPQVLHQLVVHDFPAFADAA